MGLFIFCYCFAWSKAGLLYKEPNIAVWVYFCVNFYKKRTPVSGLYTELKVWGEASDNELPIRHEFLCLWASPA